jgi:hypothetical protein
MASSTAPTPKNSIHQHSHEVPLPTPKKKKQSVVHPTAASTVVTHKATKRTLARPIAVLPPGIHVPGVTLPSTPTGDPTVTVPVTTPLSATPIPIPTLSGATPAATTPTTVVAAPTTSTVSGVVDAVPTTDVPAIPDGFVPPATLRGLRGYSPRQTELTTLPGVIADLGNFIDYASVIGAKAPAATTVQSKISTALGWRKVRNKAEAWEIYARTEDAIAWKEAAVVLDKIKPLFLFAVTEDPTLSAKYPSLAAYCTATKEATAQANVTRQKNARTKAAADAAAATAAAVGAATASAVAATKAEAAAATVPVGKAVTVTA